METPKKLKKKRGTIRTSTTKLIALIDELMVMDKPDVEKRNEMEEYWDLVEVKEKELKALDQEIADTIEVEQDLQTDMDRACEYMDTITIRKTRMKRILHPPVQVPSPEGSVHGSVHGSQNQGYRVKLPKLVIEKFSLKS